MSLPEPGTVFTSQQFPELRFKALSVGDGSVRLRIEEGAAEELRTFSAEEWETLAAETGLTALSTR